MAVALYPVWDTQAALGISMSIRWMASGTSWASQAPWHGIDMCVYNTLHMKIFIEFNIHEYTHLYTIN
jgi:hypothetical protein